MSQQPLTIDDIYKLFEQTNAALERSRIEFDRSIAQSRAERVEEEERRAAERVADRAEEGERRAAERVADRAEREKSMKQLERTVAQTSREVANLTTRWGRFVEELVRPAVVRMFRDRGININQTSLRVTSEKVKIEIDILGVNGDIVVAVECKSRLSQDDVDDMCDRLRKFKSAFPQYTNYQIYGAVAGIEINESVDIYAYRKGLYVIRTSGDTVAIANDEKFKPVAW
jgi:hypothetical protein